jgi:hypothetical protein
MLASLSVGAVLAGGCATAQNENAGAANSSAANRPQAQTTPAETQSKPLTGSIKVESRPEGADVLLIPEDESGADPPQPRGQTPVTITELAPGKYAVHLEKNGYKPFQKSVEVKPGETTAVTAPLQRR